VANLVQRTAEGSPVELYLPTVAAMRSLIRRSADDAKVGAAVAWIRSRYGDTPAQYTLGAWRLLGAVPYEFDPPGVELVRSPDQFLAGLGRLAGDCDDQTVLMGALLHHTAAPTRPLPLWIVSVSTRRDKMPHHVFLRLGNCFLDPIMSTGGRWHSATREKWPGWWVGLEQPVTELRKHEV